MAVVAAEKGTDAVVEERYPQESTLTANVLGFAAAGGAEGLAATQHRAGTNDAVRQVNHRSRFPALVDARMSTADGDAQVDRSLKGVAVEMADFQLASGFADQETARPYDREVTVPLHNSWIR